MTVADRADIPIMDVVAKMEAAQALPAGPARDSAMLAIRNLRSDGVPLMAERVYVGRNLAKTALLRLSDREGRPRLLLQVDSLGQPSLEFLDDRGQVVSRLPAAR